MKKKEKGGDGGPMGAPKAAGVSAMAAAKMREDSQRRVAACERQVAHLAAQIANGSQPEAGIDRRLLLIHSISGCLLEAKTLEEGVQIAAPACTEAVLSAALDVVALGEPHAFVALNLLHTLAFCTEVRQALLDMRVLPFLLGLLRAQASEYELRRSALSLLVTISSSSAGAREIGKCTGVAACVTQALLETEDEFRNLGGCLLREVLRSTEGRAQLAMAPPLLQALQMLAEKERQTAGFGRARRRRWQSLAAEVAIYTMRAISR